VLGQSILNPALACPNIIKHGVVADMLKMAKATSTVFSALVASTDSLAYTPMFRAYSERTQALIGSLEKTVGSLPAAVSTTAQEQSELCILMQTAHDYALKFQDLPAVAAMHAGMLVALDVVLEPHTPRPLAPSGRSALGMFEILGAGVGAIFVGTMTYYWWRRSAGR